MRAEGERARGDRTTTLDDDEVAACPDCDSARVRLANQSSMGGPASARPRYLCEECDARFSEFVIRACRRRGSPKRGLAKDLVDADPDEVGR